MKSMIGILVGIVLGLAVSALAADDVRTWATGAQAMSQDREFRNGYAAGASDMLNQVVEVIRIYPQGATAWFASQAACLHERSGGSLGQFTDFAETLWRGRADQAASILLDQACK